MAIAFRSVLMNAKVSGSKVVVTCDPAFAGKTISCTKSGTTLTQICPSTSPYTVTFEGLESGTWTISGTIQGQTFSTTAEVQDVSCVLSYGFVWTTWVDTSSQLDSTNYNTLDELLEDEEAVRELMLEHACVDYMASFNSVTPNLEKIIENDLAAKWINLSDYALDFLGANVAIKGLMDTADKYFYGEWVITDDTTTPVTWGAKGNVPVMTANNAPYGTASGRTEQPGYNAYLAFSGNLLTPISSSNHGYAADNAGTNEYLRYAFTNPIMAKKAYLSWNLSNGATAQIQGSNDGSTWVDVSEVISMANSETSAEVDIDTDGVYYLQYQLKLLSGNWYYGYGVKMQYYGRELSVSVPTMTSNTAPYGEAGGDAESTSYLAFDGDDSTAASKAGLPASAITWYKFPTPIKVKRADFLISFSSAPSSISAQVIYSDDGETWNNATEAIAVTNSTKKSIDVDIQDSHMYWGIRRILSEAKSGAGNTIQFYGLDYSEKEFEEGTTKKWLYDHGVELETIESYWNTANTSVTKNDSNIKITCNGTYSDYIGVGVQKDLTNYSLFRVRIGNTSIATPEIRITDTSLGYIAGANISADNLPNNGALDVSAINQTVIALAIMIANSIGYIETTEFWLE